MDKPYRLPDPEKQPESFLVILYKTLKKVEFNDRAWDRHYFARCMKRTQELLEVLRGDVRMAAQCMQDLKERFEADGTHWTIETIVQYSFEWKSEHERRSDRDCLRELVKAYKTVPVTQYLKAPEQDRVPIVKEPDPEMSDEERAEGAQVMAAAAATLRKNGKEIPA